MTFEENSKELEKIVEQLENSPTSLSEGTALFEKGVALAQECFKMLEESKGKITILKNELEKFTEEND